MRFAIIAAADKKMGIGIKNRLPWRLAGDLKYFAGVTTLVASGKLNAVIMGRKTWESLPAKHRPLAGRLNVVLSRGGHALVEGMPNFVLSESSQDINMPWLCGSLEEALAKLKKNPRIDKIFVVGGANLFAQAIQHPDCWQIFLTEVEAEFECDAFFPKIPSEFTNVSMVREVMENGVSYRFMVYERS